MLRGENFVCYFCSDVIVYRPDLFYFFWCIGEICDALIQHIPIWDVRGEVYVGNLEILRILSHCIVQRDSHIFFIDEVLFYICTSTTACTLLDHENIFWHFLDRFEFSSHPHLIVIRCSSIFFYLYHDCIHHLSITRCDHFC